MSDSEKNDQQEAAAPLQTTVQPTPTSKSSLTSSLAFTNLQNLKSLYEDGFITETEYTARKSQLIDQLTGTSLHSKNQKVDVSPSRHQEKQRTVIARPPPCWDEIEPEKALKITFDPLSRTWHEEATTIKVDSTPFAKGGLRMAYHMTDLGMPEEKREKVSYVLKVSIDPDEDPDVYYRDVEMQLFAKLIAEKFNVYEPPKKVAFVKAWLLKLLRRGGQVCAVERFISGPYRKHNNNYGFVNEDERNTPQSFSHFSYEVSSKKLLICDIQGVADLYTDPQIHTMVGDDKDERPFGKGNLGQRGIDQFLKTHRCNPICRYLRLPPINPRSDDIGTVPVENTVMQPKEIDMLNIRVYELPSGRLAVNASAPTVAQQPQPQPQPELKNEPNPHAPLGKVQKEHIPLMASKKTKITITSEESTACACCTVM